MNPLRKFLNASLESADTPPADVQVDVPATDVPPTTDASVVVTPVDTAPVDGVVVVEQPAEQAIQQIQETPAVTEPVPVTVSNEEDEKPEEEKPTEPVVEVEKEGDVTEITIEIPTAQLVTEEEAEEAEAAVEEYEEEFREEQGETPDMDVIAEDTQVAIENIKAHMTVLQFGLENKSYSSQTVALVQTALEHYNDIFGDAPDAIPSLENFNKTEDLEAYYQASLESFAGFISRLIRVIPNAMGILIDKLAKSVNDKATKAGYESVVALADNAIGGTDGKKENVKLNLSGSTSFLTSGGKTPKNAAEVIAFVKRDLASLITFQEKTLKAVGKYSTDVGTIIGKVSVEGGKGSTGDIVGEILKLKEPHTTLTPQMISGDAFIDRVEFEVNAASLSGSKTSEKLKVLRKNGFTDKAGKKAADKLGEMEFTPAQVVELAKLAKAFAVQYKKMGEGLENSDWYKRVNSLLNKYGQIDRNKVLSSPQASWEDDAAFDYAGDVLLKAMEQYREAFVFVYNAYRTHGAGVAKIALSASKKFK